MTYLLDSNIYMDCYDRYYLHQYFPTFWQRFTPLLNRHTVAVDVVLGEHLHSEWFTNWFESNYHGAVLNHTNYVSQWAAVLDYVRSCGHYKADALTGDKGWAHERIADPWLIAVAKHDGYTLVTSEKPDVNFSIKGHTSKNPKIPDVAREMQVPVMDLNEFFGSVNLTV